MGRVIAAFSQFLGTDAEPLANGWLRFLVSGSNNTNKDTFADSLYQIPNANPLQLDAEGRCPDVFGQGDYRVISFVNDPEDEDSPGEQLQVFDPVTAQSTTPGGGGGASFSVWSGSEIYSVGDVVTYNLYYYRSLVEPNTGLDPELETYAWERIDFIKHYNATITYSASDLVYYDDNLWLGLQSSNTGNTPSATPAYWRPVATGYKAFVIAVTTYGMTVSDRDRIIVLGAAAPSDTQFTLPTMAATTDRFRVGVYNASSYVLTIATSGTAVFFAEGTSTMVAAPGSVVELIYSSVLNAWLEMGYKGTTLGGQNIGTVANTVDTAYIDTINATDITLTGDLFTTDIFLPDGNSVYFGTDNDMSISHDGVNAYFNNTTGTVNFQNNGSTAFSYDATLGVTFTGSIHQGDNDVHYFGTGDDMAITYDGSSGILDSATDIDLQISSTSILNVGSALLTSTVDFEIVKGTPKIDMDNSSSGNFILEFSSSALQVNIYTDYGYLYLESSSRYGALLSGIYFLINTDEVWFINNNGHFGPFTDNTYNIGSSSLAPDTIYYHNLTVASDERYKENIINSPLGLNFISELNPVRYNMKSDKSDSARYGLIAQEVDKVVDMKDFTGLKYDKKEDRWGLDYTQFIAPIIKAIQELKEIVDDQTEKFRSISIREPDNK